MKTDIEIYNEMAKILVRFAPVKAKLVKYKFVIECDVDDPEGGVFQKYFDYVDHLSGEKWFNIESLDHCSLLTDMALSLREVMSTNGQEKWNAMTFSVDLMERSFETNFEYGLSNSG